MTPIVAHGPWYGEWHHLLNPGFFAAMGASASFFWYWMRNKIK